MTEANAGIDALLPAVDPGTGTREEIDEAHHGKGGIAAGIGTEIEDHSEDRTQGQQGMAVVGVAVVTGSPAVGGTGKRLLPDPRLLPLLRTGESAPGQRSGVTDPNVNIVTSDDDDDHDNDGDKKRGLI